MGADERRFKGSQKTSAQICVICVICGQEKGRRGKRKRRLGRSWTIKEAFVAHPNWTRSEAELRELRQKVTFAIFAETDDLEVTIRGRP
ncbi:MAG: hypothetical protein DRP71_03925 [Verrucomicrobia bacterium]|nr:MAG: hypothetical protein DRP71_03925 [Verrucomicrobiota bacterium]